MKMADRNVEDVAKHQQDVVNICSKSNGNGHRGCVVDRNYRTNKSTFQIFKCIFVLSILNKSI